MSLHEKRYFAVDLLTMAYTFVAFLAVAAFGRDLPERIPALAVYLGLFVFVRIAVPWLRRSPIRTARFLVQFYPMFAFGFLYYYANVTNTIVFTEPFDEWFAALDRRWFGLPSGDGGAIVGPSWWLAERFGSRWLDELIHACYFTYYTQFPLVGLAIYLRHGGGHTYQRFLFIVTWTFLVSYAVFTILPVHGPLDARADRFTGWIFVPILDAIYATAETGGGAFPSSHVAVALVCMIGAWRYARRVFWAFLVPSIGLFVATVYCSYHYLVDSLAGLVWGTVCYAIGALIYRLLSGPPPAAIDAPPAPTRPA